MIDTQNMKKFEYIDYERVRDFNDSIKDVEYLVFDYDEECEKCENDSRYQELGIDEGSLQDFYSIIANVEFGSREQNCPEISLPSSVKVLGKFFDFAKELEVLNLNDGLLKIEKDAFDYACSLKSLEIPDSVQEIEDNALDTLSFVIVHKGSYAEKYCKEHNVVFCYPEEKDVFEKKYYSHFDLYEDLEAVYSEPENYTGALLIPDGTEILDIAKIEFPGRFDELNKLIFLVLPDSVTEIKRFDGDMGDAIYISSGVRSIGEIRKKALVFCEKGSYAESWAKEHGCKYFCIKKVNISIVKDYYKEKSEEPEDKYFGSRFGEEIVNEYNINDFIQDGVLTIPEGKTVLINNKWNYSRNSASCLKIPSSMKTIQGLRGFSGLKQIIVSEDNPYYKIMDDCLYSKDGSILKFCYKRGTDVVIPASVRRIEPGAFLNEDIQVTFEDYDALEVINKNFFTGYEENIVLPKNLKIIGDAAFLGCTYITELVIPEGVESIGDQAFARCRHLRKIFIPASVKELAKPNQYGTFFDSCLEEIIVDEANPYFKSVDGVLFSKDGKKLIHYPCRKKGDTYTIPEGVEEVDTEAFYRYEAEDYIQNVIIPDTVHLKNKDFLKNLDDSGAETRDEWMDGYFFIRSGEAIDEERTIPMIKKYIFEVDPYEGEVFREDLEEADLKELYNIVKEKADAGDKQACADLSWLYHEGFGTEKNMEEAKRYLDLAKN